MFDSLDVTLIPVILFGMLVTDKSCPDSLSYLHITRWD